MASNNSLLLFKQEGQHIYDYQNVYDPDVDGSDVANSGKIVPAVRSIVIDNRTSKWRVYLVSAVDPVTFKVSYVDFPYKTIDTSSIVLNYGNDFFMLYYDNRVSPTRLIVDSKMILFGANLTKYRLMKDGVPISLFNQQNETGVEEAVNYVPITEVTNQYTQGIRRCSPCYTTNTLVDGDLVTLELYDSTGVVFLVGEVELVAKQATILNALSAAVNPIVSFDAECNQTDGTDWYIYRGQSVDNLSIYPMVSFANESKYMVPVDNRTCFIYGLDEVDSTQSGARFKVLIKYYVNDRYTVDPTLGVSSGTKRILYSEHVIKVVDKPLGAIAKLSVLPVWRQDLGSYDLNFMAYTTNRSEPSIVTDRIVNINANAPMTFATYPDENNVAQSTLVDGSFNPTLFGSKQTFKIKFVASEVGTLKIPYEQSFSVVLIDPATVPDINGSRAVWNIEDSTNTEEPYGIDDATYNRPEIIWDETAGVHYFDTTNQFISVTEFINTFFRLADPPYLTNETQAPTPNKFRIKDLNGNVLVSSMAVSNYMRGFRINKVGTTDPVVGETVTVGDNTVELPTLVILEFLLDTAVIYGVPVIIRNIPGSFVGGNVNNG